MRSFFVDLIFVLGTSVVLVHLVLIVLANKREINNEYPRHHMPTHRRLVSEGLLGFRRKSAIVYFCEN